MFMRKLAIAPMIEYADGGSSAGGKKAVYDFASKTDLILTVLIFGPGTVTWTLGISESTILDISCSRGLCLVASSVDNVPALA